MDLYAPDEIELQVLPDFFNSPACQSARGQLVCQYTQPNGGLAPKASMQPEFSGRALLRSGPAPVMEAAVSLDELRGKF